MATKQSKSNIFDLFIYRMIERLLNWANKGKERGFFIMICNKEQTHVAFRNLNKVMVDGSVTVGCDPELSAAWETLGVGADASSRDFYDDPKWMKAAHEISLADSDCWRWKGYDYKKDKPFEFRLDN